MARGGDILDPLLEAISVWGELPWTLWHPILQALAPHPQVCPAEPSRLGATLSWGVSGQLRGLGAERPTCSLMSQNLPGKG